METILRDGVIVCEFKQNFYLFNVFAPKKESVIKLSQNEYSYLKNKIEGNHPSDLPNEEKFNKYFKAKETGEDQLSELLKKKRERNSFKSVENETNVIDYHKSKIDDAKAQFDRNEITLSHIYRCPTKQLLDQSYGEALYYKVRPKIKKGHAILEIGGGLGHMAKSFLNAMKEDAPEVYHSITYTILDLSPELQKYQKENLAQHSSCLNFINANVQTYSARNKFDMVLANEMIADLQVRVIDKENTQDQMVKKYALNIDDKPNKFIFNHEAIKFLETVNELLKPGGFSYITEYGVYHKAISAVELPGHNEYEIDFGHLESVAKTLGLFSELTNVGDYLGFRSDIEVLCRRDKKTLHGLLLPYLKLPELPSKSYTREDLKSEIGEELFESIAGLNFYKLKDKRDELSPYSFYALILEK